MKPKLIDSKRIFNVIKIQRNLQKDLINKKRHLYSNIFIFIFVIFMIYVIFIFYKDKKPLEKINKNKNK